MRIIQLTDLHVGRESDDTFGVDVRKNLNDLLRAVHQLQPDHLVISGDLCYDVGDVEIYQWIKKRLDLLDIPYSLIAGNHDDTTLMASVFGLEDMLIGNTLFYKRIFEGQTFLFLDSAAGVVSEEQLDWLDKELRTHQEQIFIFMHHPPLRSGVPHMDNNYSLQNQEEVQRLFFDFPGQVYVFCGHCHVEKTLQKKNMLVQITPSNYFQIAQQQEDFAIDHYRIGLRLITLQDDHWSSTVQYFEGNKL
jgi:3',5'-cyclic-AMP phosphodiesterase